MSSRLFLIRCPKCFQTDTTLVPKPSEHYVCNNPSCQYEGSATQFRHIIDDKIHFPYNQIFVNRSLEMFKRTPYLELSPIGITETKK